MKTVYTLGREVAKCVSIKTTVSAQSTIIVRLPHATLTAPNLLLGNCKRFVGHKLSTILCRCFTSPCKTNETIYKTHVKPLLLSVSELLLKVPQMCGQRTKAQSCSRKATG